MTPLFIPLKNGLKKLTAKTRKTECASTHAQPNASTFGLCDQARIIELRTSKQHTTLIGVLCTTSFLACLSAQLPWQYCAAAILWIIGSVVHWHLNPQSIRFLVDDGDSWVLIGRHESKRLSFQHATYCTANLLVMRFKNQQGPFFSRGEQVFVWRDAVTPTAFSWLAARITLSDADAPVQNVATSSSKAVFSFSSRIGS